MTEDGRGGLRVALVDRVGRPVRVRGLADWLRGVAPVRARGAVAIALVDDAAMRRLNRAFAGKDAETDVLSFPAFAPGDVRRVTGASAGKPAWPAEARSTKAARRLDAGPRVARARAGRPVQWRHLGDIVIATGVARRQARAAGHAPSRELRVLALHGLLHLLGYDHETDDGRMARLEAKLRRRGGLTAGVIERAGRA
jgi:probable rRNA maturation factor